MRTTYILSSNLSKATVCNTAPAQQRGVGSNLDRGSLSGASLERAGTRTGVRADEES